MASFTLTSSAFPDGTTVRLYPKSNWPTPGLPSGAPVGAPAGEATMSGPTSVSGLTQDGEFWAVAQVGGEYRYVSLIAGADESNASRDAAGLTKEEIEETFDTSGIPADHSVTELQVAAANIDGAPGVPSMRTLATASPFVTNATDTEDPSRKAVADALMVLAGRYRNLLITSGKGATTAAEAGKKYFALPSTQEATAYTPGTTNAAQFFALVGADLAVAARTTKLRIKGVWETGVTAPGVNFTVGLNKLSVGPTGTLGALVEGSATEIAAPAKEKAESFASADFALPADGIYALGYTVSGAPAAGSFFALPSLVLQVHSV